MFKFDQLRACYGCLLYVRYGSLKNVQYFCILINRNVVIVFYITDGQT